MNKPRWVRIEGDGLAYTGPCTITDILVHPDANNDYADIYDGRDSTAGKPFARIEPPNTTTQHLHFSPGIPFTTGIYIDGYDLAVVTTVIFTPGPP